MATGDLLSALGTLSARITRRPETHPDRRYLQDIEALREAYAQQGNAYTLAPSPEFNSLSFTYQEYPEPTWDTESHAPRPQSYFLTYFSKVDFISILTAQECKGPTDRRGNNKRLSFSFAHTVSLEKKDILKSLEQIFTRVVDGRSMNFLTTNCKLSIEHTHTSDRFISVSYKIVVEPHSHLFVKQVSKVREAEFFA